MIDWGSPFRPSQMLCRHRHSICYEIDGRGVLVDGPLEVVARGFEAVLVGRGFTRKSLMNQLRLLAHLSRWLRAQGVDVGTLTAGQVEVFLAERRRTHTGLFSRRALGPMLGWLACEGVIPAEAAGVAVAADPVELAGFEKYLRGERRLADSTIAANMARARRFLAGYAPPGGVGELTAAEVTRALLDEGATRRPVSVKAFGYTLRALLRFFFISGITSHDLSAATLVIRSPQPSRLPVGVSRDDVSALLARLRPGHQDGSARLCRAPATDPPRAADDRGRPSPAGRHRLAPRGTARARERQS